MRNRITETEFVKTCFSMVTDVVADMLESMEMWNMMSDSDESEDSDDDIKFDVDWVHGVISSTHKRSVNLDVLLKSTTKKRKRRWKCRWKLWRHTWLHSKSSYRRRWRTCVTSQKVCEEWGFPDTVDSTDGVHATWEGCPCTHLKCNSVEVTSNNRSLTPLQAESLVREECRQLMTLLFGVHWGRRLWWKKWNKQVLTI